MRTRRPRGCFVTSLGYDGQLALLSWWAGNVWKGSEPLTTRMMTALRRHVGVPWEAVKRIRVEQVGGRVARSLSPQRALIVDVDDSATITLSNWFRQRNVAASRRRYGSPFVFFQMTMLRQLDEVADIVGGRAGLPIERSGSMVGSPLLHMALLIGVLVFVVLMIAASLG